MYEWVTLGFSLLEPRSEGRIGQCADVDGVMVMKSTIMIILMTIYGNADDKAQCLEHWTVAQEPGRFRRAVVYRCAGETTVESFRGLS